MAQQAFSSDTYPTLFMGIPALEAMHAGLIRKRRKVSERLHNVIDAGVNRVVDYYDRTAASDSYLVSMGNDHFFFLFLHI